MNRGAHFIEEISTSLKELTKWRGVVDKRLENLETLQANQQSQVDDLERESLLIKEDTKKINLTIDSIQSKISGSCTKFMLEIFLIFLVIIAIILCIYYLIILQK